MDLATAFSLIPYHDGIEHFNYDLTVDWALELIKDGVETENLLILASFSKPADASDIRPYVSAALADLDIEEKKGNDAVFALINHYLNDILQDRLLRENLNKLYNLFLDKDSFRHDDMFGLMSFYLLYHGWRQLEDIGENCYFEGADLNNIDTVIKAQAQVWIDQHFGGNEKNTTHNTTS